MEILKVVKFKRCLGRGRKKKLLVVVQMKEYPLISLVKHNARTHGGERVHREFSNRRRK
ncbi:hypothetical protein C1H46_045486 [Malus baccata]|uniref:Uncharacterized protein n=1 Tax=Malus baccata TaxID=106549 RepID=A0A540K422_MALBA|nr:hypothetical protein C1H46_045486 [Malus baccata]